MSVLPAGCHTAECGGNEAKSGAVTSISLDGGVLTALDVEDTGSPSFLLPCRGELR
ncbi:hypothetical protein [Amycolatopsis panacis]|uniref:hypothetical protein n=1 Tax=Amycolatopsis panacis TaxID=2340917 RepID=UPI001314C235|nr:hypothetical protein [Amycolatopsis panacis]